MKKYTLLIRADGGREIGMGHLMRTNVIAEALRDKITIEYVCNSRYKDGIRWLKERGYKVYSFEEEELLVELLKIESNLILTDNYNINDKYINMVKNKFKIVGYIDDNEQNNYLADFVINQNFGAESLLYDSSQICTKLLGSRYLLVREEFRRGENIIINNEVKDILITVGGTDIYNLTSRILNWVKDLPYNFHIVIGIEFPYAEQMKLTFKGNSHFFFYDQPKMQELMKKCDMAISSCGSTLYELGIMGIPTVGMSIAENQRELARRMHESKMLYYLGDIGEIDGDILRKYICEIAQNLFMRKKMSQMCREKLNKDGMQLVVKEIEKALSKL